MELKISLDSSAGSVVEFHSAARIVSGEILYSESEFTAMADLIKAVEGKSNSHIPTLQAGDSVSVHVRIKEGDKERVQEFKGTIIRLRDSGNNASFTVRRTASNGIGVERTFLLRSPRIEKVEVQRHASVRRAQLYYLRELTGKKARLREKREA